MLNNLLELLNKYQIKLRYRESHEKDPLMSTNFILFEDLLNRETICDCFVAAHIIEFVLAGAGRMINLDRKIENLYFVGHNNPETAEFLRVHASFNRGQYLLKYDNQYIGLSSIGILSLSDEAWKERITTYEGLDISEETLKELNQMKTDDILIPANYSLTHINMSGLATQRILNSSFRNCLKF